MNALPQSYAPAGGFTLVELMVSFAVLGLTLTLLFSALWFSVRSWDAAERHRDATHTLSLVQTALARQLRQARPLYLSDGAGQRRLAFAGDADSLTYIAPLSRRDNRLYLITLYREHRSNGEALRLRFLPWQPGAEMIPANLAEEREDNKVELVDGLQDLDIAYFGALEANAPAAWHARWDHPNRLPERIRLRITPVDARAVAWPDLTLCPDGGADCLVQRSRPPGTQLVMRKGDGHAD